MEHRTINRISSAAVILIFGVTFLFSGCYYDNEECLYPEGSCDTNDISYATHVWPVISGNCVSCHSGNIPEGNVSLENYDDVASAGQIAEGQYGSLLGTISHHPDNSPMPKNGNKLSDCTITQIRIWIENGTPNN